MKKLIANNETGTMTAIEHLKELRNRIMICVVVFLLVFVIALRYAKQILETLFTLAGQMTVSFAYLYPQEVFIQYLNIAVYTALIVTVPIVILEICLFALPGLMKGERPFFGFCMGMSVVLFYVGMFFSILIMIPFVMQYFDSLNNGLLGVTGMVSIEKYVSLVKTFLLAFGIVFEIPVASSLLTMARILTSARMKKARSAFIVLAFVIGAIITPPDVISQCMVAIPMIFLFECSIFLAQGIEKKRNRRSMKEVTT